MSRILTSIFLISALVSVGQALPSGPRLVRSQSGPSGKVVGSEFVLDEVRNRFVYPQDRGLVISFDWQIPAGDHVMTATWKDPTGKAVYISSDLRVKTEGDQLRGYWTYDIYDTTPGGIWALDVRVDGQPAGVHNFELVVPAQPTVPTLPTANEIYKAALPSIVWVHKLDRTGRRIDTSTGFVFGKDKIASAFQAIDSADGLEVEFSDGRRVPTVEMWAANRLQDWVLLKAETGSIPALTIEPKPSFAIGEPMLTFSVESGMTRTFGSVDVSGTRTDPVFGDRIQIAPPMSAETAGGPLFSPAGKVVGILGGSLAPGSRYEARSSIMPISPYWAGTRMPPTAVPITLLKDSTTPRTLKDLEAANEMTRLMRPTQNLESAFATLTPPKGGSVQTVSAYQFSRRDSISVISLWQKHEKEGKGSISAHVYDAQNRVLVNLAPKKISLSSDSPTRIQFDFTLSAVPRGNYRIDVEWEGQPTWRGFVTIVD